MPIAVGCGIVPALLASGNHDLRMAAQEVYSRVSDSRQQRTTARRPGGQQPRLPNALPNL